MVGLPVEGADALGGLRPLLLVARRLGPRLPDEHVDLRQLAIERGEIGLELRHERESRGLRVVRAWSSGSEAAGCPEEAQSSGIRIQPWRIAYTTAWVRSFTESLRRMELMWFLTVCSLIDSA